MTQKEKLDCRNIWRWYTEKKRREGSQNDVNVLQLAKIELTLNYQGRILKYDWRKLVHLGVLMGIPR